MSQVLLEVRDVSAGYNGRAVLNGLSMALKPAEVVVLVGHNGAGKTTLLRAIFGLIHVDSGAVVYDGREITNRPVAANVADGLAFIPQGRGIFPDLSVDENLRVGGLGLPERIRRARAANVLALFPPLSQLGRRSAGTLSGGEQQMLALGRALMREPAILLVDEPSVGLSPALAGTVMQSLQDAAHAAGAAIVLAEQNVREALRVADRVYVLKVGRVATETTAAELLARNDWRELF
jgi:branched-chain amino acid transport system ATP-binding protein